MTEYMPRSEWTATQRGGARLAVVTVRGVAVHWPGSTTDAYGVESAAAVASRLRGWRDYHVGTRGWSDIGYNVAIDQAGRVWDLRGVTRVGAHCASPSWPEANHHYVGVLLVLGDEERPSAAMLRAFVDFRFDVFEPRFGTDEDDVRGHGQVRGAQTSCPGPYVREAINDGHLAVAPGGEGVTGMSWDEDLSRDGKGPQITALANDVLHENASRQASGLLGYAAASFYRMRQASWADWLRGRFWSYRWPWRAWIKEAHPDITDEWPNGYTAIALLQNTYGMVRRMIRFEWWRDFVGNAIWSRQHRGDGDMHAEKLHRADTNSTRAVALAEANNALLAELVQQGGGISEARVRELFDEAISRAMVNVEVSVTGSDGAPPGPVVDGSEDDPDDDA